MGIVGDRPHETVVNGLFARSCRGRFDAWLILAWQFRYKTPTSLKMMKAKENILLYLGDFATYSQMSRYR